MNPMDRRKTLQLGIVSISIGLIGCIADNGEGSDQSKIDSENYEIKQFAPFNYPDWYDDDKHGDVSMFATEETALDTLDFDEVADDRRDEVKRFIEDTDYNNSRILFISSVGPYQYYTEIGVEELVRENDTLVGTATAEKDEDGYDNPEYNFPSALVRVIFDDEPPDETRITIVDGWGDEGAYETDTA